MSRIEESDDDDEAIIFVSESQPTAAQPSSGLTGRGVVSSGYQRQTPNVATKTRIELEDDDDDEEEDEWSRPGAPSLPRSQRRYPVAPPTKAGPLLLRDVTSHVNETNTVSDDCRPDEERFGAARDDQFLSREYEARPAEADRLRQAPSSPASSSSSAVVAVKRGPIFLPGANFRKPEGKEKVEEDKDPTRSRPLFKAELRELKYEQSHEIARYSDETRRQEREAKRRRLKAPHRDHAPVAYYNPPLHLGGQLKGVAYRRGPVQPSTAHDAASHLPDYNRAFRARLQREGPPSQLPPLADLCLPIVAQQIEARSDYASLRRLHASFTNDLFDEFVYRSDPSLRTCERLTLRLFASMGASLSRMLMVITNAPVVFPWSDLLCFTHLTHLNLAGFQDGKTFHKLRQLGLLRFLGLSGAKVSPNKWSVTLPHLPRLTHLDVSYCRLTVDHLRVLDKVPSLSGVSFRHTSMSPLHNDLGTYTPKFLHRLVWLDLTGANADFAALLPFAKKTLRYFVQEEETREMHEHIKNVACSTPHLTHFSFNYQRAADTSSSDSSGSSSDDGEGAVAGLQACFDAFPRMQLCRAMLPSEMPTPSIVGDGLKETLQLDYTYNHSVTVSKRQLSEGKRHEDWTNIATISL